VIFAARRSLRPLNPLRRSESAIAETLLRENAAGKLEDAGAVHGNAPQLEETSLSIKIKAFTTNARDQVRSLAPSLKAQTKATIRQVYLALNVTVFWAFDARGALVDIWVWKTFDGP